MEDWQSQNYFNKMEGQEYFFIPAFDSPGSDLYHKEGLCLQELFLTADKDENVIAFNSGGWFKHSICSIKDLEKSQCIEYNTYWEGLYVKKSKLSGLNLWTGYVHACFQSTIHFFCILTALSLI